MGTANSENDASHQKNTVQIHRPEFYTCNDCGQKFTKLALEVHKKSCSEDENCSCKVCKSININCLQTKTGTCMVLNPETSSEKRESNFRDHFRDLSVSSSGNSSDHEDIKISSPKLIINDNQLNMTESSLEEDTEESLEKSPVMKSKNLKRKRIVFTDSLENCHDGEPCNRKLFCNSCKKHVFWESVGSHAFTHSIKREDNHLICLVCDETRSSLTLFLMHFTSHMIAHPDCSECVCNHPNCVGLMKVPFFEHCYAGTTDHRCYICLKSFSQFTSLITHMKQHTKDMPYSCEECTRSFRQIGNLQRHMTTHRGDRPYKCRKCCKSFADPATLRNHTRVHTRETPFVCEICRRGFSQIGNLKRHMAIHVEKESNAASVKIMNDKNNANQVGVLEEATSQELKELLAPESPQNTDAVELKVCETLDQKKKKRENGKFTLHVCHICGKKYTWSHDLKIHYRVHTGEKPYKCEICSRCFSQSGAVQIHKNRHHSSSPPNKKIKI
ncbi:zinc finger protein 85 [Trichonephila inaurata madagascariensis]|uniref:Zinc finger protein 85 n=1 Tax=Trichonephila inaurata madagascariensis TaxID=2747483 RepID=A0A8X7C7Y3_9ARAC|nr:zinc finger protein 85 [Trichonephila inaurata madagascariensis]